MEVATKSRIGEIAKRVDDQHKKRYNFFVDLAIIARTCQYVF